MDILLCNYEYPPLGGGGGVFCAQIAGELAQRHRVTVLTSAVGGQEQRDIENGVEVIRVPTGERRDRAAATFPAMFRYVLNATLAGQRLVREREFDIINSYFAIPTGPVGHRLARRSSTPHVLTILGGDIYDPSKALSPHRHWVLRSIVRRLLRSSTTVVAESKDIANNMSRYFTPELGCELIPLGIERPPPARSPAMELGLPPEAVTMVTVGRLVERKAVDQLIDIAQGLADNVYLLILGDGPLRAVLEEHAAKGSAPSRVRFLGHVSDEDKFAILHQSDVFVSTSQHEGFGLVFLEAMACGLPVISYDRGGQIDFLTDDETGFVVTLNDSKTFSKRCQTVLTDKTRAEEMGKNATRVAEEHYIETCAQRYEDLFKGLVANQT